MEDEIFDALDRVLPCAAHKIKDNGWAFRPPMTPDGQPDLCVMANAFSPCLEGLVDKYEFP